MSGDLITIFNLGLSVVITLAVSVTATLQFRAHRVARMASWPVIDGRARYESTRAFEAVAVELTFRNQGPAQITLIDIVLDQPTEITGSKLILNAAELSVADGKPMGIFFRDEPCRFRDDDNLLAAKGNEDCQRTFYMCVDRQDRRRGGRLSPGDITQLTLAITMTRTHPKAATRTAKTTLIVRPFRDPPIYGDEG